jgi:hypothetical protein
VTSDNRADVIRIKGKALKEGNFQPDHETPGLRDERFGATFGATNFRRNKVGLDYLPE